jgi:DNA-binding NtrC family response regulator
VILVIVVGVTATMKHRILIVDDEDDINLLFKMVLEDNGFKVDTFNDPLVALHWFLRLIELTKYEWL